MSEPLRENITSDRATRLLDNIGDSMDAQRQRRNEQSNDLNPRDRLFHALFIKVGLVYSRFVPKRCRIILELIVLTQGILLFTFLSYLHFSFGRSPINCLNGSNNSWPRDGILQVRIQPEVNLKRQLPRFYSINDNSVMFHPCHNNNVLRKSTCDKISENLKKFHIFHQEKHRKLNQCYRMNLSDYLYIQQEKGYKKFADYEYVTTYNDGKLFEGYTYGDVIEESQLFKFYEKYLAGDEPVRHYIFEYAKEFGFLRLSHETRQRLQIPMKIVTFDPNKEHCFGDSFSRFLLKYFLGYDDILMNSIKKIADMENNSGYMLNVVTGDHYKFVSWGIGRGSYVISLLLMFLFTVSISTLLRYCHQQVFYFIIRMLQMMDRNVVFAFPIAPLFTVVLSLVGMETIMSEYFNDTTTSFYIILIVWAVDQFDTICCHTTISQKYWLRFFYLYHFIFYAYHYRFNGQYSSLALAATWFLIQHSMLYFFHNYELPAIESHLTNERRDEETYLDEAVQIIVEGIEMVAGQPPSPNPTMLNDNHGAENLDDNEAVNPGEEGPARIFVFAVDRPIIQMFREFIRQFRERLNLQRAENQASETLNNTEPDENESVNNGTTDILVTNTITETINEGIEELTEQDFVQPINDDILSNDTTNDDNATVSLVSPTIDNVNSNQSDCYNEVQQPISCDKQTTDQSLSLADQNTHCSSTSQSSRHIAEIGASNDGSIVLPHNASASNYDDIILNKTISESLKTNCFDIQIPKTDVLMDFSDTSDTDNGLTNRDTGLPNQNPTLDIASSSVNHDANIADNVEELK